MATKRKGQASVEDEEQRDTSVPWTPEHGSLEDTETSSPPPKPLAEWEKIHGSIESLEPSPAMMKARIQELWNIEKFEDVVPKCWLKGKQLPKYKWDDEIVEALLGLAKVIQGAPEKAQHELSRLWSARNHHGQAGEQKLRNVGADWPAKRLRLLEDIGIAKKNFKEALEGKSEVGRKGNFKAKKSDQDAQDENTRDENVEHKNTGNMDTQGEEEEDEDEASELTRSTRKVRTASGKQTSKGKKGKVRAVSGKGEIKERDTKTKTQNEQNLRRSNRPKSKIRAVSKDRNRKAKKRVKDARDHILNGDEQIAPLQTDEIAVERNDDSNDHQQSSIESDHHKTKRQKLRHCYLRNVDELIRQTTGVTGGVDGQDHSELENVTLLEESDEEPTFPDKPPTYSNADHLAQDGFAEGTGHDSPSGSLPAPSQCSPSPDPSSPSADDDDLELCLWFTFAMLSYYLSQLGRRSHRRRTFRRPACGPRTC